MSPGFSLTITAVLAGFVLKSSVGFAVSLALTRLIVSPGGRFLVWLGFLAGAGTYWLWLAYSLLTGLASTPPAALATALAPNRAIGAWRLPPSWAFTLGLALQALAILYLLALVCFFFGYLRKRLRLRWVLRFAYDPPAGVADLFQPIASGICPGRYRVRILSGVGSPATFGWLRPTILLPPHCLEESPCALQNILRHELYHVRRRDFAADALAGFCRTILFFHPAVWYVRRRMELERELACDLSVVSSSPENRARYAECLVRFARFSRTAGARPWNLDFARLNSHLEVRVHSLLREPRKHTPAMILLRTGSGAVVLTAFLAILPSLAVALSCAYLQKTAPALTVARIESVSSAGWRRPRRWPLRADRSSASAGSVRDQAPAPEALQLIPPEPNFTPYHEPVDPRASTAEISSGAEPPTDPSDSPVVSNLPPITPGSKPLPEPTVTSLILDTMRQIAAPDNDHDKDDR